MKFIKKLQIIRFVGHNVDTRAEKSKSLIRWKRRKGGKRREKAEKAEKADLVVQLAFWQKLCQKERQATGSLFTLIH